MPHEFRTIEEFVLLLEKKEREWADAAMRHETITENGFYSGKSCGFSEVLTIIRTSNIGIVYPKSEDNRLHSEKCFVVTYGRLDGWHCSCGAGNPL